MENLHLNSNGDSLENECKPNCQKFPIVIDQESTINPENYTIINSEEDKETKSIEKYQEKEGTVNMNIVKHLLQLQQLINDDEKRLERNCFSKNFCIEEIEPFSKIEFSKNMSISEFEISMDLLKENIKKKFNNNFDLLRDLDAKVIKLTAENESLRQTVKPKSSKKSVISSFEEKCNFTSLNDLSYKKQENLLKQLEEEIATLEKENLDNLQKIRNMKTELRKSQSQVMDLTEDLSEANESINKLIGVKKMLKKQIKEFNNKNTLKCADQSSKYEEQLENMQLQLSDQEYENKILMKELENLKEQNKLIENYAEDSKNFESVKAELEEKVQKKDSAFKTMKLKIDQGNEQIELLQEENKKLKLQCENVETECTKKQNAINTLRNKLRVTRVTEENIDNLQRLPRQLASKDIDIQKLNQELNELKQKLEEKNRNFDELKNHNSGLIEEIKNMKLLNFRSNNK